MNLTLRGRGGIEHEEVRMCDTERKGGCGETALYEGQEVAREKEVEIMKE